MFHPQLYYLTAAGIKYADEETKGNEQSDEVFKQGKNKNFYKGRNVI